jgi:hypothetical protein
VAASSRRTEEKVASRRGSGRHWRRASRARALSLKLGMSAIVQHRRRKEEIPKKASDHVLEQADSLLLDQLVDHVAKNGANSIETLIGLANVRKPNVVQQDLLYDEDGYSLTEFRSGLHDAQAKGNDLSGQEEVDDFRRIVFDERANNAERCKTEVLEWSRLGRCVEERVEEEGNVR